MPVPDLTADRAAALLVEHLVNRTRSRRSRCKCEPFTGHDPVQNVLSRYPILGIEPPLVLTYICQTGRADTAGNLGHLPFGPISIREHVRPPPGG
jgi:hypothetical protein